MNLEAGRRGTAQRTVTPDLTAEALGSGTVPVFSTPALLAMIEAAAVDALGGGLEDGATSVGTWVELEHLAASPVGAAVRADAELVAVDGRTVEFTCTAYDGDKVIGRARHRRAIVDRERFLARL